MLKHFLLAALLFLISASDPLAQGARARIPELSGYFLDGDRVSIPADLSEPFTLLVITYDDPGSEAFESWQTVAAGFDGDLAAVFIVLLGERGAIDRAVTAGRLRRSVLDPALRTSMVPVFQEANVFRAQIGIEWNSPVIALLVTDAGEVVWHQSGPASLTSPGEIRGRLDRTPAPETELVELPPIVEPGVVLALAGGAGPEGAAVPDPIVRDLPMLASAAAEHLPVIEGVTLAGRKLRLPGDLGETGTRLVLLPGGGAGDALQTVLARMEKDETDPSNWLVLVFQGRSVSFGKAFAAGKLRAEIPSVTQREHVLPIYMELAAFESLFGLPPTDKLRLINMSKSGMVSKVEYLGQAF